MSKLLGRKLLVNGGNFTKIFALTRNNRLIYANIQQKIFVSDSSYQSDVDHHKKIIKKLRKHSGQTVVIL